MFEVKRLCFSGVDVETLSPSTPAENDTWKVGERKISSCCDVAVFTTERESGSALRLWTQGSVGGFWHYWSHGWRLKPTGAMEWWRGGTGIPADQGLGRLCVLCPRHNNTPELIHTVWERALNKAAAHSENTQTSLWWLQWRWEWRRTKILILTTHSWHSQVSRHQQHFSTLFCPSCFI